MLQKLGTFLGGLLSGLLATGLLILFISEPRGTPVVLEPPPTPGPIRVHVAGAVANPGVYELPDGSIARQAIEKAGGALDNAAMDRINLASTLSDGEQITVPIQVDASDPTSIARPETNASAHDLLDINTATAPELERLPGLGPSLAQKIVEYREKSGPFGKVEDITHVSGIGSAKFDQIRDLICVR
ncbi:MAG: ComEA family DNA-binding protein [Anaerolineales bacterium]